MFSIVSQVNLPSASQRSGPRRRPIDAIMHGFWNACEQLGTFGINVATQIADVAAVLSGTVFLACRPSSWTPPVRNVFSRQMLFTSVDSIPAAMRFAAVVGVMGIVQAVMWIDAAGLSPSEVAPILWRSVVREIAPLLACLVVIGRSGIAISAELATMHADGEIEVIDSQGIDPMTYLVMPRVVSVMISVFCLAIITAVTIMVTGYLIGSSVGAIRVTWNEFYGEVSRNFERGDLVFFTSKTLVAGGFAGVICCLEGVRSSGRLTDVPRVASRAGIRALTAIFAISAILSVLFYEKLLVFKFG
ncbi:ABC transporter permease [Roseiconus lacunae]|uniref:ABC transporter permease n=1 Tax=Roseiconus lacunae TaxID=2605694 RepID=UPI0011F1FD15|nr:ABC transporter permease [Roseiconus lacunae]MCD0458763.1 ABC transporter permease [Roseiconus lacunae]WRQ52348.1 ABC transporter permease [Stieleria sp. HD01]